jgi:hypothetical protein
MVPSFQVFTAKIVKFHMIYDRPNYAALRWPVLITVDNDEWNSSFVYSWIISDRDALFYLDLISFPTSQKTSLIAKSSGIQYNWKPVQQTALLEWLPKRNTSLSSYMGAG